MNQTSEQAHSESAPGVCTRRKSVSNDLSLGRSLGALHENLTIRSPEPQQPHRIYVIRADARRLPLNPKTVDLIVTSPPYWRKRDYGDRNQIGQESTIEEYIGAIREALSEFRRVLRPTGSVFLNIGDTYLGRSLVGVPALIESIAREDGWIVRNRIIWAKDGGSPEPTRNRLVSRHEFILHLVSKHRYYYDMFGYAEKYGNGSNPGDVWHIRPSRHMGDHLAPFPEEIVERAIYLACPSAVCVRCGIPRKRVVQRTSVLDPQRPQARRALELAKEKGLTPQHIAAIQATGISDAGKGKRGQNGTGHNSADVQRLAKEAKLALGGYFREFTFAKRETTGWNKCACGSETMPGVVLDPFMGTGTTLRVAERLKRSAIGADITSMGMM